jgi:hypothetical protein
MERRKFLKSSSALFGVSSIITLGYFPIEGMALQSQGSKTVINDSTANETLKLRPHHILDIISSYGNDEKFEPHPYGHSLHIIAEKIISNPEIKVQLVVGNDDICKGCKHLIGTKCDDVLSQLNPSPSKQAYNDVLDSILLDYLGIKQNTVITIKEYAEIISKKMPDIVNYCTHPKENREERLKGMKNGLLKIIK